MKHSQIQIFSLAALLLVSNRSLLWAQVSTSATQEPKTKIEAFEKQTGTVIIRGFLRIGLVSGRGKVGLGTISVECRELVDASSGERRYGIVVEVSEGVRLERVDRSFVHYDEIEPLINGIDYISNVTVDVTKLSDFEVVYKTKGDLNVITYSNVVRSGEIKAAVRSGYIGPASAYISMGTLGELRALILQAKRKLDSIK